MFDLQNRNIDYLRISVTDRCNLRCVYCMPAEGIEPCLHDEVLTYEEILKVCRCAAALGICKIKLTGGEPLARKGTAELIRSLKAIEGIEQVTMTSNGILLYEQLPALAKAGLDAVNISLDTLDPDRFERITRRRGLDTVLKSIDLALELGLRVKINCLPVREFNGDHLMQMAELARTRPVDVRFIELMPIGYGKDLTPVPSCEIQEQLRQTYGELAPCNKKLGNGPASYFSIAGFQGNIGFISAVSTGFCGTCNRIRLTSTGFLKLCLHYNKGVELREYLRKGIEDADLTQLLQQAILQKPLQHHFGSHISDEEQHTMAQIGG
ncbi:cyclic pyranopterin phosphate synthase [Hydrogenoanaerobacterium saccharovorans]|uniref:GTP 3',8-cyclase n=1 Tax=Hydrogenoanaerobacterium saccharovorans TaxID=474960 RepID=A0A1H7YZQ6_9FIRM|nr:GTP 3',8-cyclase MoaA [Hydrogenoanaerobacterium saccharovorans]RPF48917.1 cyclic pyranopterin phosphate synthase [Hydrogenoanaerobacterium saccharovorans]SEM51401.1 cyclic pyranopterin phosphate synthase [Hydrogenoanaerobacterium saccharovorans]